MLNLEIENVFLPIVDSTQKWAKENYKKKSFDPEKITCIIAEEQTSGIGRFHRTWIAPKDSGITATFYFQIPSNTKDLSSLALILSLSLIKLLKEKELTAQIKWPNDLMLNEKKISGILGETLFENNKAHIFLGIGININMDEKTAAQIGQPATSLKIETKKNWDKTLFLEELQNQFKIDLKIFLENGFSPFRQLFESFLLYKDKEITFFDGQKEYFGHIVSITPSGELVLKLKNGKTKTFQSGDIL